MIDDVIKTIETSIQEFCCGDRDDCGDWRMRLARMICGDHREDLEAVIEAVSDQDGRPTVRLFKGCGETPDVWLLVWREVDGENEKTEIHDHGPSEVAVKMFQGRMREVDVVVGKETILDCDGEDCEVEIPSPYIHQCGGCDSGIGASVHVYYPPLQEMGIYEVGGDGKLVKVETWKDPEGCRPL